MGLVYRAIHDIHGEVCAKVIKPEHKPTGAMLRRFQREAKAACLVSNPHVVRGYGLEESQGLLIFLQEMVRGGDLQKLIRARGNKLDLFEALRYTKEIAKGLEATHSLGLVHRDLKPENVLLDSQGRAKLADLGLVLQVDGEPLDGKTILTRKGQALGTPYYMAPEQWEDAHEVDARTDLYALGVTLHHLLTGTYPISGSSIQNIMVRAITTKPDPIRQQRPEVPEPVETLILRLLSKRPEDRPASAANVVAVIEKIEQALSNPTKVMNETASPIGVGAVLGGKLKLLEELGRGGMGVVYKARHTLLEEDFAVKVIHKQLTENVEFRSRFLREAKALLAFVHEGATSLRDFGEHNGALYMALDFAPGLTLKDHIKENGLFNESQALELAEQVLSCLEKAHQAGLVHRDIKPANLIVQKTEGDKFRIRVLDFGIAKMLTESQQSSDLTMTGAAIGTPYYMAPEQAAGDAVDSRADLYSLACVLFEVISGRKPIEAKTSQKLQYKIQFEVPPSLTELRPEELSKSFADAVRWGLEKQREDRPKDASDFLAALKGDRTRDSEAKQETTPAEALVPFKLVEDQKVETEPVSEEKPSKKGRGGLIALLFLIVAGLVTGAFLKQKEIMALFSATPNVDLKITEPRGEMVTGAGEVTIKGTLSSEKASSIWIGTKLLTLTSRGGREKAFEDIFPLVAGENRFEIRLDKNGPVLETVLVKKDNTGPVIKIEKPKQGGYVASPKVSLSGVVKEPHLSILKANGTVLSFNKNGDFAGSVELSPGEGKKTIQLLAIDRAGNESKESLDVVIDMGAPEIVQLRPQSFLVTEKDSILVSGTVKDLAPDSLLVDGKKTVALKPDHSFEIELPLPKDGRYSFTLIPIDKAGNKGKSVQLGVQRDSRVCPIAVTSPEDGALTNASKLALHGVAGDSSWRPGFVEIQGVKSSVDRLTGQFRAQVDLEGEGTQRIKVVVKSRSGRTNTRVVTVVRDSVSPSLELLGRELSSKTGEFLFQGTVKDDHPEEVHYGKARVARCDGRGRFTIPYKTSSEGETELTLTPVDGAGNKGSSVKVKAIFDKSPPSLVVLKKPPEVTNQKKVLLEGRVKDLSKAWVNVKKGSMSQRVELVAGVFRHRLSLSEGSNTIQLQAEDTLGYKSSIQTIKTTVDSIGPFLSLNVPSSAKSAVLKFSGQVTDKGKPEPNATVHIEGRRESWTVGSDGNFSGELSISNGINTLRFYAKDPLGNRSETRVKVVECFLYRGQVATQSSFGGLIIINLIRGARVKKREKLQVFRGGKVIGTVVVIKEIEAETSSKGAVLQTYVEGKLLVKELQAGDQIR